MKQSAHKPAFIALAAIIAILTGCKEYTCECTLYDPINGPGSYSNYKVKKKDKTRMCTDKSTQPDAFGRYRTCVIK